MFSVTLFSVNFFHIKYHLTRSKYGSIIRTTIFLHHKRTMLSFLFSIYFYPPHMHKHIYFFSAWLLLYTCRISLNNNSNEKKIKSFYAHVNSNKYIQTPVAYTLIHIQQCQRLFSHLSVTFMSKSMYIRQSYTQHLMLHRCRIAKRNNIKIMQ